MAAPDELALYVIEGCGYCQDVRDAASELGVTLEERDLRAEPRHLAELMAARGRRTVPVLRIGDERWMGESQDIIAYLYERFGEGRSKPRFGRAHLQMLLWGLLLSGGVAGPPLRGALWTLACAIAAARSAHLAYRTQAWHHAAIAAAFAFGALSIGLEALGVAELEWWWAAFAVAGAALLATLAKSVLGARSKA